MCELGKREIETSRMRQDTQRERGRWKLARVRYFTGNVANTLFLCEVLVGEHSLQLE